MQTIEAIEQRRAIKTYDPNHKMTEQEIEQLLSAAILSPSSFNIQNWRFVVVTDQAQKDKLKEAAWNQAQVSDASIVIVVCADLKAWDKEPARYWQNAPKETQEILVPMITKFYQGNEQLQRDEAMRSTGIVAQTIMLRAKDMGYDSCPMIGFDPVKDTLKNEVFLVGSMIKGCDRAEHVSHKARESLFFSASLKLQRLLIYQRIMLLVCCFLLANQSKQHIHVADN